MTGALSEWNRSAPRLETHYFDFELFKNCADNYIQLLVKSIEKVDEIYWEIKKVNAIETKEEGDGE